MLHYGGHANQFKFPTNLNICFLDRAAILQYGDYRTNFKFVINLKIYYCNKTAMLQYGYDI